MSSNASASARGWEFQENAAILLALKHLRDVEKVRVEGQEDIELTLTNGNKFYAQAKSSKDPQETKNALAVLKKALKTLDEDASLSDCERLIYVTNLDDPFVEPTSARYLSGPLSYSKFSALPKSCQEKVKKICAEKRFVRFDFGKFYVLAFPFVGDDENKYRIVKQEAQDFLNELEIANRISSSRILSRWQLAFRQNSSKIDTQVTISKADLIWPLICWICELNQDSDELDEWDDSQKECIVSGYQSVINDRTENFEFVSRVMSDYNNFKSSLASALKGRQLLDKFSNEFSCKYADEFVVDVHDDVDRQDIARIALKRVVGVRARIYRIKAGAGL